MTFDEWVTSLPAELKGDTLWKVEAYRLALFAAEIGWYDVTELMKDRRTIGLADQLYRSLGSVSANLAEGYSHHTGKSRAQFYQYSHGSARESRDWYYQSHHILKEEVVHHRISLLTHVIKLLLTMIPQQRGKTLKEPSALYLTASQESQASSENLLEQIPLP